MFHKENLIFKVCLYEFFICRTQADFKPVKRTHICRVEAAITAAAWREEGKDVTVVTGRAVLCHPSSSWQYLQLLWEALILFSGSKGLCSMKPTFESNVQL